MTTTTTQDGAGVERPTIVVRDVLGLQPQALHQRARVRRHERLAQRRPLALRHLDLLAHVLRRPGRLRCLLVRLLFRLGLGRGARFGVSLGLPLGVGLGARGLGARLGFGCRLLLGSSVRGSSSSALAAALALVVVVALLLLVIARNHHEPLLGFFRSVPLFGRCFGLALRGPAPPEKKDDEGRDNHNQQGGGQRKRKRGPTHRGGRRRLRGFEWHNVAKNKSV